MTRRINLITIITQVVFQVITVKSNLKRQRNFLRKTLYPEIENPNKNANSALTKKDYRKIKSYYGLAVPAILGEAYATLREEKLAENERRTLSYLGAITGLFDDFFDNKGFSDEHILKLVEEPNNVKISTEHERLFVNFYTKALESSAHPHQIKKYFHDVFDAQVLSEKQTSKYITVEEIKSITFLKGGVSLLFYRSGMNALMNEDEKEFLYQFGSLLQLENDIFDIYKDYHDSIKTLATIETNMDKLRDTYNSLWEESRQLVMSSNFSLKGKTNFLHAMAVVVSRGYVCFDLLKSKESLTSNKFELSKYERKDLICDMEKPTNIIKSIYYYSTLKV